MKNFNFITLQVKCPHCGTSLMDGKHKIEDAPSIKLNILLGNKRGSINLSSVYGSYNVNSEIDLISDEIGVFSCPHCRAEITSENLCKTCQAPMAEMLLDMGGKIHFCTRKGCLKHSVEFEDLALAIKKFYDDYDQYTG